MSRVLLGAVIAALLLTTISVTRAHRPDWGKGRTQVLRPNDKAMLEVDREYLRAGRNDRLYLENSEICYAQFPVRVTREKLPLLFQFPRVNDKL